jgi:hypothetical protein
MPLPVILTVPAAVSLNRLRDALHAAHLPATVAPSGRPSTATAPGLSGVKITPGRGIDRKLVAAFVRGFIAGFES